MTLVVAKFEHDQAKKVKQHAQQGIGYLILEENKNWVIAAFHTYTDSLPAHVTPVVDPQKITKFERLLRERQGLHNN